MTVHTAALTIWTAGIGRGSSWVFTWGVTPLGLTANVTLQTEADIAGIGYRPPLGSMIILDTRMDAASAPLAAVSWYRLFVCAIQ